jgi:UDP-glucose 4-epimerase
MNVLFTGGSSFTGFWFIHELIAAGHSVTAVFRRQAEEYPDPTRRQRVALASAITRPIYGCSFGDDKFMALVVQGGWDVLCHHAADVTNYKSPNFDTVAALRNNTHNLPAVVDTLRAIGCERVLLSGSVFEGAEGAGSQGLPDFSPYGLSKALTARMFAYYCERAGVGLGKFVIPNPFHALPPT